MKFMSIIYSTSAHQVSLNRGYVFLNVPWLIMALWCGKFSVKSFYSVLELDGGVSFPIKEMWFF